MKLPLSRLLVFSLLVLATLTAAPGKQKFTGIITDSMCADGDHSRMKMGSDDAECTNACIDSHGAVYVLYDGKAAYTLSDQTMPEVRRQKSHRQRNSGRKDDDDSGRLHHPGEVIWICLCAGPP